MTHHGGLSLSIIIWKIGGEEPSFLLPWGPTIFLAAVGTSIYKQNKYITGEFLWELLADMNCIY
jgi:hypothetical protein